MRKPNNYVAVMLFLLGLFSQTQLHIVGYLDIAELFSYVLGPFFFIQDLPKLKKHGFGTFLFLWFLCTVGCMLSAWLNGSYPKQWMRGVAVPIAIFCLTCTFHHFLMIDFKSFKWYFLGAAISGVICIFVFQRGTSVMSRGVELKGAEAAEHAMGYSLFWLQQISTWLLVPVFMRYLKLPRIYTIAVGIVVMLFGFFSAGNRSGMLVTAASVVLIAVGGTRRRSMDYLRKHFLVMVILGMLIVPFFTSFYKYCAVHGYLGEAAYKKYIAQTRQGSDALSILRAGRGEFFIGLTACLDKPIVGHGPWAFDDKGYTREYMRKYASVEDYVRISGYMDKYGVVGAIPAHSWIIGFWLWYGVLGLICMGYVGVLFYQTLRQRLRIVPELYGYWAYCLLPTVWHFFFSPFGGRTGVAMLFTLCLLTRAIAQGRFCPQNENGLLGNGMRMRSLH